MNFFKKIISLKTLITVLMIFLLYNLIGFYIVPAVIKSISEKQLTKSLNRPVYIKKVKMNPYKLIMHAEGIVIIDKDRRDDFITLNELFVDLEISSIWKLGLVLEELKITRPSVSLIRYGGASFNFSDLIEGKETEPEPEAESKPFLFSLNNIRIVDGSIHLRDLEKNRENHITGLMINIPFISDFPDHLEMDSQPVISGRLNETPFLFQGKTKPFHDSLETTFNIDIDDLDIPYYMLYVPFKLNFLIDRGLLVTRLIISHIRYKEKPPSVNLKGDITLKDIDIQDTEGSSVIKLPFIKTSISTFEILSKELQITEVDIRSPELNINRDASGTLNLLSLLPEIGEEQAQDEEGEQSEPLSINLEKFRIGSGKIGFSDLSIEEPFRTDLKLNQLTVKNFKNIGDEKADFQLSLKTEKNEVVELSGNFIFSALKSTGRINLKNIDPAKYSPYYSDSILFDINDAALSVSTKYQYAKTEKGPGLKFTDAIVSVESLVLIKRDEEKEFLKIPALSIKNTAIDLTEKRVVIGDVATRKGMLFVKRLNTGDINLQTLFPPRSGLKESSAEDRDIEVDKPWVVKLVNLSAENYMVNLKDSVPTDPAAMLADNINLKIKNFSTEKNKKSNFSLSLRLNEKGTISTNGAFSIEPLFADLKFNLDGIEIKPFQPYFTDIVNIIITDGSISSKNGLILDFTEEGLKGKITGEVRSDNFASIDKLHSNDFLKWESLQLDNLDLTLDPVKAYIDKLDLNNFYSRLIVNPDGTLNVATIVKQGAEEETPAVEAKRDDKVDPGEEKPIEIGKIAISGGEINFTDRFIKPNYSANLHDLEGDISGLSTDKEMLADVDIRGSLEGHAPLTINGKINPLSKYLYVDLKAEVKDFELSPVTPYSGKYVGYAIEKGKLFLAVKYNVKNNKIDADQKVLLDQLTLGNEVDSPDAISLPIKLGIALLKDRQGRIDLDIPVTGDLDDPEFNYGHVVFDVIVNLITKIVTSPLAILGGAFGGGEELSYMDFSYGDVSISEENTKKLDTLITILYERPGLNLEIAGEVDRVKDTEVLRKIFFERKLKSQKLKYILKKGQPPVDVDEVVIESKEYKKYLKKAYKAEKFPKPKNFLGFNKMLPVPEMEKLIYQHLEVTDSDLRQLAMERSKEVKNYISKSEKVKPERIFMIEPNLISPAETKDMHRSRLNIKIK